MDVNAIANSFRVDCGLFLGIFVIVVLGLLVGFVRRIGLVKLQDSRIDILLEMDRIQDRRIALMTELWPEQPKQWKDWRWRSWKSWREYFEWSGSGSWVGCFERFLFFGSFWMAGASWMVPAWLVMKTAVYWQSGNFAKFPEKFPDRTDALYFLSMYKLSKYNGTVALVGTAANILCAICGFAVGNFVDLHAWAMRAVFFPAG